VWWWVAIAVSFMDEIHCISRARHKQRSVRFTGHHVCQFEAFANASLNKREARNALARAVFFNRQQR
jgi:hypothetical protein